MNDSNDCGSLRDVAERAVSRVTGRLRPTGGPTDSRERTTADDPTDPPATADGGTRAVEDDVSDGRSADPGPIQDAIELDRRRFVQFAAAGATVGIAGCGTQDDTGSTATDEMDDGMGDGGMTETETNDGMGDDGMGDDGMTDSGMSGGMTETEMDGGGMDGNETDTGTGGGMTATPTDGEMGDSGMGGGESTDEGMGDGTTETPTDGESTDGGMGN